MGEQRVDGPLYFQWLIASRSTDGTGDRDARFITQQTLGEPNHQFPAISGQTDPDHAHDLFVDRADQDDVRLVFESAPEPFGTAKTWFTNTWINDILGGKTPSAAPVQFIADRMSADDFRPLAPILSDIAGSVLGEDALANEVMEIAAAKEPEFSHEFINLRNNIDTLTEINNVYTNIIHLVGLYTASEDLQDVLINGTVREDAFPPDAVWEKAFEEAADDRKLTTLKRILGLESDDLPSEFAVTQRKDQFPVRNLGKTTPRLHVLGKSRPHPAVIAAFGGKDHQTTLLKQLGFAHETTSESQGFG